MTTELEGSDRSVRDALLDDTARTCLSYWHPKLEAAGVPVPKTIIVRCDPHVIKVAYGENWRGWLPLVEEVKGACEKIGYPAFLRTGQTSNKHNWRDTCFVPGPNSVAHHMHTLVEFSCCCDMIGLPCDVWAVRELLPTVKHFEAFNGMPICREYRFFVRGGSVRYWTSYWPKEALEEGFPYADPNAWGEERVLPDDWDAKYAHLSALDMRDARTLHDLARTAGKACGGDWSVDIIETERGWFVTDMAAAERSYGYDKERFEYEAPF